ncbi:MAG: hypothetical protein ACREBA_00990 [Nitrosotalea sp.]
MKHDRCDLYTTGLCDIIDGDRNKRLCFFEIDGFNALQLLEVIGQYYKFQLDVLVHKTGKGFHFLSPTLVDLTIWKEFHKPLKHINSECPMTCLRITPNKWPNEEQMWKDAIGFRFNKHNTGHNVHEANQRFWYDFDIQFDGGISGTIKTVRYPLPTQITCNNCDDKFDKVQEKNHICEKDKKD